MSKKKLSSGKDGVCMVVPEGWVEKTLDELFNFSGGVPASRAELSSSGYPYLHYGDIHGSNNTSVNVCTDGSIPRLDIQLSKVSNGALLQDGDVVFVDASEDDEGASRHIVVRNSMNRPFISGLHTIVAKPKTDELDNLFKEFCFLTEAIKLQFKFYAVGTKVTGVNKLSIKKINLQFPVSKSEQRAIAEVLSDMDCYIASLDKLIAKKKALKQGAMQELLTGKRRLPGFDGEWKIKTLGDIGHFIKESINPQAFSDTLFSEYSMPAFDENRLPKYVWGSQMHSIRIKITDKVLLFNKLNVRQKRIWFIDNCSSNAVCSSEFLPFYSTQVNLVFLAQVLFSDKATTDFEGMSTGTSNSQKRITPDDFLNYEIYIPQIAEQSAIAAVLSDMDAEIEVLTAKLNKAKSIKQGMMQELLTGRIRLVKPDVEAVILGTLASKFGTEQHPFTAFDCQKFPYLFHRHVEGTAKGYKKFAAGPYNPDLKYRTARPIALERRYIRECTGLYKGFVADENIQEALNYFAERYDDEPIKWLDQFHYIRNRKEELELLTTVDQAMVELQQVGNPVTMHTVKEVIQKTPVWKDKLTRPIFSDENIFRAIEWSIRLFGKEE